MKFNKPAVPIAKPAQQEFIDVAAGGGSPARDYKVDKALSKVKTSPVTSTPPQLQCIKRTIKETIDGTTYTFELHIWDGFSRMYLIHDQTSGIHSVLANFELGYDKDHAKRIERLRFLKDAVPLLLTDLLKQYKGAV